MRSETGFMAATQRLLVSQDDLASSRKTLITTGMMFKYMDRGKLYSSIFLFVACLTFSASISAHAFTIPEYNNSQVEQITPARDYLEDTKEVDKSTSATFILGVEHILDSDSSVFSLPTPFLNDHGYLLLGILILPGFLVNLDRSKFVQLVEMASSFALGHGLALFSVYLGLLNIPGYLVEAGIAFSIAIVALERLSIIEGLRDFDLKRDILLLFVTGFWHGNGFAGVVESVQFSSVLDAFQYLVVFTLGVDFGQLIFLIISGGVIYKSVHWFDEEEVLKATGILLVIIGMSLGLFRLLPVVGGVL